MALIEMKNISKRLGIFGIEGLDLSVPDGRTLVILGPTGCGKSTVLRLLAGLERPDAGRILFDGRDMTDLKASERSIGMVFQNYALYPHWSTKTNILSFFLFKKRTPELTRESEEKLKRTSELLGVDIEYLLDRSPKALSGGEKQRVALGRCITRDPSVFLLDEPFSNLDARLRERYRVELKKLLRQFRVTTVYVTHDQAEALVLADILAIMKDGRLVQAGTYQEIFDAPVDAFTAEFLNPDTLVRALNQLETPEGATIGFRPADAVLTDDPAGGAFACTVVDSRKLPVRNDSLIDVEVSGRDCQIRDPAGSLPAAGLKAFVRPLRWFVFDRATGRRLRTEESATTSS
jgi:ABC-type sugar transport system ATPase subunit